MIISDRKKIEGKSLMHHRKFLTKTRMEQNMICGIEKVSFFRKKYCLIDLKRLNAETHNKV